MDSRVYRRIQMAANVAIIAVAILLCIVIIKDNFLPTGTTASRSSSANQPVEMRGMKVKLEGVDWAANKKTLVLGLSTSCHFCTESMPFYKQLVAQKKGIKTIAVFTQPVVDAKRYLEGNGVAISDVRSSPLDSLGIDGTPTLLLVDGSGKIVESWRGKLDTGQQNEVIGKL